MSRDTTPLRAELNELRNHSNTLRWAQQRLYAAHHDLACTPAQFTEALDTAVLAFKAYHWHLFETHPVHPEDIESTPEHGNL